MKLKGRITWVLALAAIAAVYVWAGTMVEFSFDELINKSHRFFNLLARMWSWEWWVQDQLWGPLLAQLWKPLLDTFRMAILGTFLGALLSLPLIVLSTRTITRAPWLYYPVRFFMGILRTIPDLLYAVLFVAAFGLGTIAGVPALTLFSAAIIAKMTSESADNVDRGPIEAVEATGAGRWPVVLFAFIPQILPIFISYTLYVFEINIRVATVLAYVGAGGIGQNLMTALNWFDYSAVAAILIVIFVIVFGIDYMSGRFRESLVEGKDIHWSWKAGVSLVAGVGIVWAASSFDVDPERISRGMVYFNGMVSQMAAIDLSEWWTGLEKMMESVNIALIGTTISMFLAFPLGFLCAGNLGFPRWMVIVLRQVPNAIRTFPEIILAIFFIATYGPGAFPGVMALAIHSIGMLSRLNYEIVETMDRGPIEALSAIGATQTLRFRFAVLPQVLPEFLAMAIYRFEINVRAATTLGIVGAGGIGALILRAVRQGYWSKVGMYLLIVIVVVSLIDYASAWARKRIIEG